MSVNRSPACRRAPMLRRLLGAALAAATAAVSAVAAPAGPAAATPSPSSVEDQIDREWNALEPVIEEYNRVHNQLKRNRADLKRVQDRLAPLELQVSVAMRGVQGLAAEAYMQGSPDATTAMVLEGDPTALADRLVMLDVVTRNRRDQIRGVTEARDRYAAEKDRLDALTRQAAARDADLAGRRRVIEAKIDDLQKLRLRAYGEAGRDDGPLRLGPCPVTYTNDPGGRAAQKACSLIGARYVFGSDGPTTFDCSGLTKTAWASVGVHLEHYTKDQWGQGRPVDRADLKPGDLVFFHSDLHHMGMYVGGGMMVHAPHTGDRVRMAEIDKSPIAGFRRPG